MREAEGLDDGGVCEFGDWWRKGREHEGTARHTDETLEEGFWGMEEMYSGHFVQLID